MPKLTHEVLFEEWLVASETWNEIMNPKHGAWRPGIGPPYMQGISWHYFENFLGKNDYRIVIPFHRIKATEAAYNKIKLLNSPHARTLLKAFKARTGYHKEIP